MAKKERKTAADELIASLERLITTILGLRDAIECLTSLEADFCVDGFIKPVKTPDGSKVFTDSGRHAQHIALTPLFDAVHDWDEQHGSDEQQQKVRRWLSSKLPDLHRQLETRIVVQKETQEIEPTTVCSDVHLGTRWSRETAFYQWLDNQQDRRIILMGDILDLWIYSGAFRTDADLIKHVASAWKKLWTKLAEARGRGCVFDFIPGNHDGFAFFIESSRIDDPSADDEWSKSVVCKAPVLDGLRDETMNCPLVEVADIYYPFLMVGRPTGRSTTKILLTHGHFATAHWRLINGLPKEENGISPTLSAMSTVFAHKNARRLRRLNNEKDWLWRTHAIEDISVAITNAVLVAYDGAIAKLKNNPGEFRLF